MGTDKALVELGGEPLILRALAILREAGLEASIAGARSDLSVYGQIIKDTGPGPLGGICAALGSTTAEYAVITSVDAPLIPSSLLSFLLGFAGNTDAGVTLLSVGGFAQTFPVVIHRSLLPALQSQLDAGNDGCYAAFRAASEQTGKPLHTLAVENLVQAGQVEHPLGLPTAYWFLNVNSPDDLARAEELLPSFHRVS